MKKNDKEIRSALKLLCGQAYTSSSYSGSSKDVNFRPTIYTKNHLNTAKTQIRAITKMTHG